MDSASAGLASNGRKRHESDVTEWQQQLAEQSAAAGGTGRSRIFDQKQDRSASGRRSSIFEAEQAKAEKPSRVSAIFGRKKNQDDGLSDLSAEEKQ